MATALCVFCAAPVVKKDFLYIPVYKAESGTGLMGDAAFNENDNTFRNVANLSTIAFYKGAGDTGFKRAETDGITMYSVNRQDLAKFNPNTTGLLLMKTGFTPGYDYTAYTVITHTEYAHPDNYIKDINVDIEKVRNGIHNMDFALIAINVGNDPIKELKIFDVLPEGVQYTGSRYATKDDFIPLNADLAVMPDVKVQVVKDKDKTILVFDVISPSGIAPAEMVEILVNVDIKVPSATN